MLNPSLPAKTEAGVSRSYEVGSPGEVCVQADPGLLNFYFSRPKLFPLLHLSAVSSACGLRPGVKGVLGEGTWQLSRSSGLCGTLGPGS